jgi:xylulokinase
VTVGWSNHHAKAHLYRSLLEGVAFELRHYLAAIAAQGSVAVERHVTVGGGGARSALWLSILRDVLGVELRATDEPEPVALGAAMLAATGAGLVADLREAARSFVRSRTPEPADAEAQARYDRLYREVYVPLREAGMELTGRLTRIVEA